MVYPYMKKVTFLLPRTGEVPIGGFKIVYEYGNRLAQRNVQVTFVYGIVSRKDLSFLLSFFYRVFRFFRFIKYKYFVDYKTTVWFKTNPEISHKLVYSLSERNIPKSDIIIATSWATAFWLNDYCCIEPSGKYYFIQHFEDWHAGKDKVITTWKMNLNKIVIAPWLQDIACNMGEKSVLVENAFNQDEFYLSNPIADRNKYTAIMLWHDNPFKGCSIGLKALEIVLKRFPDFSVKLFGVPEKPVHLPPWVTYYRMPQKDLHRKLYNQSAIFIGTSYSEGWGLTLGEGMLCGCAIACTNNPGYTILAENNVTALLSEVGDAEGLANNIIKLVEDDLLRLKIAEAGWNRARSYTWERSFEKFVAAIKVFV